jgi:hypothetical protein
MHPASGAGAALLALLAISACGAPDPKALQKLACEQAAANLDLQSLSQMDALRKALGVAPDVDPISACKALGARMDPPAPGAPGEAEQTEGQP